MAQTVKFTQAAVAVGPLTCNDAGIGVRDKVLFTFGSLNLELRKPDFGNQLTVDTQTNVGRLRSGKLRVVRGEFWPTLKIITMNYSVLTKTERDDLKSFLITSHGLEIDFTDWEDVDWTGIIVSDEVPLIAEGRGCPNDDAQYSAALRFMGVKV